MPSGESYLGLVLILVLLLSTSVAAQLPDHQHAVTHQSDGTPRWEGSPDGKAYSEFNHHLAAGFVLLIGLSELLAAFPIRAFTWTRFVLPGAMLAIGVYLLGWSDHDAWPIGSLSFSQTVLSGDLEILQHKLFAVLLLSVGTVEALRWLGRITGPAGAWPLPILAILGGLLLFLHNHGDHPEAHKIMISHIVMGTIAIGAGTFRLAAPALLRHPGLAGPQAWQLVWPGLIMLIGVQLFLYME